MFFGPQPATVVAVQPVEIHGTRLYDVAFRLDSEPNARSARLGPEVLEGNIQPGDQVVVHFLMQTVTKIEKVNR